MTIYEAKLIHQMKEIGFFGDGGEITIRMKKAMPLKEFKRLSAGLIKDIIREINKKCTQLRT